MSKSWAPEVFVDGNWSRNGLRFATQKETEDNARHLFIRWTAYTNSRATEADEPANYRYTSGKLEAI